jgi:hypothetical protein
LAERDTRATEVSGYCKSILARLRLRRDDITSGVSFTTTNWLPSYDLSLKKRAENPAQGSEVESFQHTDYSGSMTLMTSLQVFTKFSELQSELRLKIREYISQLLGRWNGDIRSMIEKSSIWDNLPLLSKCLRNLERSACNSTL